MTPAHALAAAWPAPAWRRQRGFTLTELTVVCGAFAVLMAVALPGFRGQGLAVGRLDAVDALTRLQSAQERHRAAHGLYAPELAHLRLAATSAQGRYTVTMALTGPDTYRASAQARADGPQAGDRACETLVVEVHSGFAQHGPSPRCWQR